MAPSSSTAWGGAGASLCARAYAPKVIGRFGARRTLVGSLPGQGVLTGALLGILATTSSDLLTGLHTPMA
ncbi:hypothetical protein ABZ016_27085 [Streptomyces sp. NPDC006372]|uniref:hypothetical protein n=1 Tax=Streptomyces sp. NPDC006372 TaxID=3155599 RepID=UPI0033A19BD0